MEITGRLTANAEARKVKGGKEIVTFTLAVNDGYKSKDGLWVDMTEFFSCAYWLSSKVADRLQKGTIVTVSGRIYLNEYKGSDGNHHANLAFHANGIRIIGNGKNNTTQQGVAARVSEGVPVTNDDLPF